MKAPNRYLTTLVSDLTTEWGTTAVLAAFSELAATISAQRTEARDKLAYLNLADNLTDAAVDFAYDQRGEADESIHEKIRKAALASRGRTHDHG